MSSFITILLNLIPLYILIFLGYISVRLLRVQKETIAKLLIYIINPAVVFYGTYTTKLGFTTLSLPLLIFCICTIISLSMLRFSNLVFTERPIKHLFAYASATANNGYFGLPVALALFGQDIFSAAVLTGLGFTLFENTIGFYLISRGHRTIRESLLKVTKLPAVYAFILGLLCNILLRPGAIPPTIPDMFKGAYSVLGMMMVGIGLAGVKAHHIDRRFIILLNVVKFMVWPLVMLLVVAMDVSIFHLYEPEHHSILMTMAIMPIAANTVAFATECKVHPDKVAVAVLVSTLFALFYVPFIAMFL